MKHTRFEYIGPNGREITLYGEFEQSVQDDGQTLKVFGSKAAAGWRPIETAPRDGSVIFVWHVKRLIKYAAFDSNIKIARWIDDLGEWQVDGVGGNVPPEITHWMPIPTAPGAEQ